MDTTPVEGVIEPQPPKRRGCFFWGCLSMLILLVLLIGTLVAGFIFLRNKYTSPTPQPVPVHMTKPGQYEEVKARLKKFEESAKANRPAQLELSADDLNTLIVDDPQLKDFAGKGFVRIEGTEVSVDVSIPLEKVPLLGGRWLNGTLSVVPRISDGRLELVPKKFIVNGEEVPPEQLANAKTMIIPTDKNRELDDLVKNAKSIEVRDKKIVITR